MNGLMMDVPLTITSILEYAIANQGEQPLASRQSDGSFWRYTYADFGKRVARLANALLELGVRPGDRVGTFAWNNHRHHELYFAIPAIGAVLAPINIRLFPEQVAYVMDHAKTKLVFVDDVLVPALEKAHAVRPNEKRRFVVMGKPAATSALTPSFDYETLLEAASERIVWPQLDEQAAAGMCFTSATTGDPKAAVYTHRSQVLHAMCAARTDIFGIRQSDVAFPIVPMFHVNAWGLPYAAPMIGASVVFPGPAMDAPSIIAALRDFKVTVSAGVPTVWLAIRDELDRTGSSLPDLERIVIGGSAIPPALYEDLTARGIQVIHAWGMTEMSPLGTVSYAKAAAKAQGPDVLRSKLLKQGVFMYPVQAKILDDSGSELPRDGKSFGELWVRGPSIASGYYKNDSSASSFKNGWFKTGDICTIDELGYMQLVDRSKDLVKSGGEWISSVDVENTLMGHPAVKEACVFGVAHPRWIERPVASVVLREGHSVSEDDLREWLGERLARWWVPDRVVFIDAIPRTGVGKFLKRDLRERYAGIFQDEQTAASP